LLVVEVPDDAVPLEVDMRDYEVPPKKRERPGILLQTIIYQSSICYRGSQPNDLPQGRRNSRSWLV